MQTFPQVAGTKPDANSPFGHCQERLTGHIIDAWAGGNMAGFTASWQDGVLRLSGELDLATDEALLTAFRSASNDGSAVILDLSELRFIDSTGIRAFVTIAQEASPRGVILRSPQRAVRKVIDLTRLEDATGVRVAD